MGKLIYRHPEGISLNGKEYILNDDNTLKTFDDENKAKCFLLCVGYEEEDIDEYVFIEDENESSN